MSNIMAGNKGFGIHFDVINYVNQLIKDIKKIQNDEEPNKSIDKVRLSKWSYLKLSLEECNKKKKNHIEIINLIDDIIGKINKGNIKEIDFEKATTFYDFLDELESCRVSIDYQIH